MTRQLHGRRLIAALLLIVGLLFLAACGEDDSSGESIGGGGDPVYTDPGPTTTDSVDPGTPTTCQTDDECFTFDQMLPALNRAMGFVEPFLEAQYATPPFAEHVYHVDDIGGSTVTDCGEATTDDAFYCPTENSIYLGQEFLWLIYSEVAGDAGVALVLAHEYGHHLQNSFGVPWPATGRETIPFENQADCVAGAWAAWADEQGYFTAGDAEEILSTLEYVGSAEGPDRDHGTSSERTEAVLLGLEGGLYACNDFYSATPLLTG